MRELSLHILDIVQNAITANADLIHITISEDITKDLFTIEICDNGAGISDELLSKVLDPFTTSRTTRRVGLGLPLFKQAAEAAGGSFCIESELGTGTKVSASFKHGHIDRQPLGNISETVYGLIMTHEEINFIYKHIVNNKEFEIDTREIKKNLGNVPLNTPDVLLWLNEFLTEGEKKLAF